MTSLWFRIFAPVLCLFFGVQSQVSAQGSQILSVTPPLFQLSINPGEIWQSSLKVVNGNPYELTVYTEVVNFEAMGEEGRGKFIPILNDTEREATLAEWIEVPGGPYVIPPEQSKEIQFFVEIPKDAAPGGHFAAILVNTEPPKEKDSPIAFHTSQTITSLFFVRVEGDVVELADIREFSVTEGVTETPSAEFSLRFENKGNVLVQPRGDIIITNMWGTERGVIPVNNQTHFGNVLPRSIRDFKFSWKGESSLTDIGRYKAIATLAYGENGVKSASATSYFWVIPIKATLITLGTLIAVVLLISWMIKLYVRRMLILAGVDVEREADLRKVDKKSLAVHDKSIVLKPKYKTVTAPLQSGARDLRDRLSEVDELIDVVHTIFRFVVQYRLFFISVLILILIFVGAVLYVSDASKSGREYEVIIQEGDRDKVLTNEEIEAERALND